MAKLTSKQRKAMSASQFAGPDRSFPVNDRIHAEKALQLVGRSVKAGNTSPAAAAKIRSRARAVLDDHEFGHRRPQT